MILRFRGGPSGCVLRGNAKTQQRKKEREENKAEKSFSEDGLYYVITVILINKAQKKGYQKVFRRQTNQ